MAVNIAFKDAIGRIWQGLAAQLGKTEPQVIEDAWEEMRELGLLPESAFEHGSNRILYWNRGHVPPDWRIVRFLAEIGKRRAKLPDEWLREFLRAAGYPAHLSTHLLDEWGAEDAELERGVRHNLPPCNPGRFVGRAAEMEKLRRLLMPNERAWVVTIDGVGGVGKSELVVETADWYVRNYATLPRPERFQAIVWVTAKETVLTPRGIIQRNQSSRTLGDVFIAIGSTLGRQDILDANELSRERLVRDALTRQRTLLIIDNLDTMEDEGLLSFIREVPQPTKVLITTRHVINVAYSIRLTGLTRADTLALIAREADLKGVKLPAEAERLHDLTGGVPLAVIWSIGHLAFGLTFEAVVSLLEQADSDLNRYCFEKSVSLIENSAAYELLLALALFAKDASREALGIAASVANNVLLQDRGLAQLEILSLVNRDPATDRFTMLPLTRNYIRQRLEAMPELRARLWGGIIAFYKGLFSVDETTWHGRFWQSINQLELYSVVEREWDNLHDLHYRLYSDGSYADLLTLGLPLIHPLNYLGQWPHRIELCHWLIEAARHTGDAVEAWLLIDGISWIMLRERKEDELLDALNQGRIVAARYPDLVPALALADTHEAYLHIRRGDLARARQLIEGAEQALASVDAAEDLIRDLVMTRLSDRWVRFYEATGEFERARETNMSSLHRKKLIGEDLASTHYNIGNLSLKLGDLTLARTSFQETLNYPHHKKYHALARYGLAQVAERMGDLAEAARQGRLAREQLALFFHDKEVEELLRRVTGTA